MLSLIVLIVTVSINVLGVVMLSVIVQGVVMLSVMAPLNRQMQKPISVLFILCFRFKKNN